VAVAGRVDDDAGHLAARLLDPVDQLALMVGLAKLQPEAQLAGAPSAGFLDIRQAGAAVDLRLAGAEQVQIGSVEDENRRGFAKKARLLRRLYHGGRVATQAAP
jgi:hypothetical protein